MRYSKENFGARRGHLTATARSATPEPPHATRFPVQLPELLPIGAAAPHLFPVGHRSSRAKGDGYFPSCVAGAAAVDRASASRLKRLLLYNLLVDRGLEKSGSGSLNFMLTSSFFKIPCGPSILERTIRKLMPELASNQASKLVLVGFPIPCSTSPVGSVVVVRSPRTSIPRIVFLPRSP